MEQFVSNATHTESDQLEQESAIQWPASVTVSSKLSTQAQVAAIIRKELKAIGIPCTVRSDSFSMGDSVRVKMIDVPHPIVEEIEARYSIYKCGHFNGQEDIYEYSNSRHDIPQTKYLDISSDYSDEVRQAAWDWFLTTAKPAEGATLPTDITSPEFRTARVWEQWAETMVWRILSDAQNMPGGRTFWAEFSGGNRPQPPRGGASAARKKAAGSDGVSQSAGSGTVAGVACTIEKHQHTKRGFDMWIVVLADRVSRGEFSELLEQAKAGGGWYSRQWGKTPGGYAFKCQAAAEQFAAEVAGSGDPAPVPTAEPAGASSTSSHAEEATPDTADSAHDPQEVPLYDVVAVNNRTGEVTVLTLQPETAKIASVLKSRFTEHPARRIELRQVGRGSPPASEAAPAPITSNPADPAITSALSRPDEGKADKLRKLADAMQPKIDGAFASRLENTAKRIAQAARARTEGQRLERTQKALRVLADMAEAGETPPALAHLSTRQAVYNLMAAKLEPVANGYHCYHADSGKPASDNPAALLLWGLVHNPERAAENELTRKLAAVRLANIPGYFPTPAAVADEIISQLPLFPGCTVLEPSAGSGELCDAIRSHEPEARIVAVELNPTLADITAAKGHEVICGDILDIVDIAPDFVLMNPPFEQLQDVDHVRHAFELLKPGGRLVAIMSPAASFHRSSKAAAFREWFEELGGVQHDLPSGSFKPSGTGVASVYVVIDKPVEVVEPATAPGELCSAPAEEKLPAYGWDPVKLSEAYTAEQLRELHRQVEREHRNELDEQGHPLEDGRPTIYLYDRKGRRKLDAIGWAIAYQLQEKRAGALLH